MINSSKTGSFSVCDNWVKHSIVRTGNVKEITSHLCYYRIHVLLLLSYNDSNSVSYLVSYKKSRPRISISFLYGMSFTSLLKHTRFLRMWYGLDSIMLMHHGILSSALLYWSSILFLNLLVQFCFFHFYFIYQKNSILFLLMCRGVKTKSSGDLLL